MSILTEFLTGRKGAPEEPSPGITFIMFGPSDWNDRTKQYEQGYKLNAYVARACNLYAVRVSSVDPIAYD